MDRAKALATAKRGVMVAAAGCGKTHTIARAVAEHGSGRDLILTHTNAGVEALRLRLRVLGAASRSFRVDTIAGWTLGLAGAFPRTSALEVLMPRTPDEYAAVYASTVRLLEFKPIREIVRASYGSVYVDEYQDCSLEQHKVVLTLADVLPCRVVGDPLQGIFNFASSPTVDWTTHVEKEFAPIEGPTQARRWSGTNPELGEWLADVRTRLANDPPLPVDLRTGPSEIRSGVDPQIARSCQLSCCHSAADRASDRVVAIHARNEQCHGVARQLRGRFSCVEPIESPDLTRFAARIDATSGYARAVEVLDFAGLCMTKVKSELRSVHTAFRDGRRPRTRNHPQQVGRLLQVADDTALLPVRDAFESLALLPDCHVYRRELLRDMNRAIDAVHAGETGSLEEAAWIVRNRTRRRGRVLPRCAVGTTLLIKGLEFDHALVLDATALKARNLYVALTRGSKSLTVICRSPVLTPQPGC